MNRRITANSVVVYRATSHGCEHRQIANGCSITKAEGNTGYSEKLRPYGYVVARIVRQAKAQIHSKVNLKIHVFNPIELQPE